jgi:asparagine synthase (glutamine-hydrolysing)
VYGGYNRYLHGERLAQRLGRVAYQFRRLAGSAIGFISPHSWNNAYRMVAPVLPSSFQHRLAGEKIAKFGELLRAPTSSEMYLSLVSAWQAPQRLVAGAPNGQWSTMERILAADRPERLLDRMMLADQHTYLVDDQLAKVDRVSMAAGLEARVPLLDHRLVEFSWRLPAHMKVRDGRGKWLLRQLLFRLVPESLVERPKMGLSVPIDRWLRGPLRPWAEHLLEPGRLRREGYLNPAPITSAWAALQHGRSDVALGIWAVLMFQAWHEHWHG